MQQFPDHHASGVYSTVASNPTDTIHVHHSNTACSPPMLSVQATSKSDKDIQTGPDSNILQPLFHDFATKLFSGAHQRTNASPVTIKPYSKRGQSIPLVNGTPANNVLVLKFTKMSLPSTSMQHPSSQIHESNEHVRYINYNNCSCSLIDCIRLRVNTNGIILIILLNLPSN